MVAATGMDGKVGETPGSIPLPALPGIDSSFFEPTTIGTGDVEVVGEVGGKGGI